LACLPDSLHACPSVLGLLKGTLEAFAFVWTFGVGLGATNGAAWFQGWTDVVHGGGSRSVCGCRLVKVK
jgi:hypothetical protein